MREVGLTEIIPNSTWLERAEIRMECYFDMNGKLRETVIYRFVYSL